MNINNELLIDAFSRVRDIVRQTINDLSENDLVFRPTESANSIVWLVWHLTRIQDDHISGLASKEQVWTKDWYDRFGLPFDKTDTRYGHDNEEVDKVRVSSELLTN